jgi:HAD superfamily hydrolase (TIGR01509 family)
MRWKAALLDLYDTLAWTEWPAFRDLMSSRLNVDTPTLLAALSRTRSARSVGTYPDAEADMAAVLEELGINDRETAHELAEMEREFFAEGRIHLFDDSLAAIRDLREDGVQLALISNCSHSTRPTVQRLGLDRAFDAVILSFEVGAKKPQPAIYRAALEALDGVDPSTALFVDDQARYCDGARDLGLDTRLIMRPGVDPPEGFAPDMNGHTVITDLRALLA